jgi:hypothetical protein
MISRKEDYRALRSIYAININGDLNVAFGIPELKIEHRDIPIDGDDAVVGDAGLDHLFRRTDRGRSRLLRFLPVELTPSSGRTEPVRPSISTRCPGNSAAGGALLVEGKDVTA